MNTRDYPEAEVIVLALDEREEEAKDVIVKMSFAERRRFQEALASVSYWIAEVNSAPSGAIPIVYGE